MQIRMIDLGRMGATWCGGSSKEGTNSFTSRGEAEYENRLLSAMPYSFGGHLEVASK